uniref:SprT-like domain-containing protein n=1 Tax=viral metagenome TaxID=1070528 RepID=A0A6C0IVF2_9ZZZZ
MSWYPYHYTNQDKIWRKEKGKIDGKYKRTEQDMCERHPGNNFTKGNNTNHIGCGKGHCCTQDLRLVKKKTFKIKVPKKPIENPVTKPIPPVADINSVKPNISEKEPIVIQRTQHDSIDFGPEVDLTVTLEPEEFESPKIISLEIPEPIFTEKKFSLLVDETVSVMSFCRFLSETKIDSDEIIKRREYIYLYLKNFLQLDKIGYSREELIHFFSSIDKKQRDFFDLMLHLYDEVFFNNFLLKLSDKKCLINICWNNKCTSTAGFMKPSHTKSIKNIKIELAPKVLMRAHLESEGQLVSLGGLYSKDVLETLIMVFEHELVHGIVSCFCSQWSRTNMGSPGIYKGKNHPIDGHGIIFMSIANNFFGLTDYRHSLFTTRKPKKSYTNMKWDLYSLLKPNFLIKAEGIPNGIVVKSGGQSIKNATIYNIDTKKKYYIPYSLITSYTDINTGKTYNKFN